MTDKKVSELSEASSVDAGDYLYILDSSDGLSSKKAKVASLPTATTVLPLRKVL